MSTSTLRYPPGVGGVRVGSQTLRYPGNVDFSVLPAEFYGDIFNSTGNSTTANTAHTANTANTATLGIGELTRINPIFYRPTLTPTFNNTNTRNRQVIRRVRRRFRSSNVAESGSIWVDTLLRGDTYLGDSYSWEELLAGTVNTEIKLYGITIAIYNFEKGSITELIFPEEIQYYEKSNPFGEVISKYKFENLMRYFWRNMTNFNIVRYKDTTKLSYSTNFSLKLKPGEYFVIPDNKLRMLARNKPRTSSNINSSTFLGMPTGTIGRGVFNGPLSPISIPMSININNNNLTWAIE